MLGAYFVHHMRNIKWIIKSVNKTKTKEKKQETYKKARASITWVTCEFIIFPSFSSYRFPPSVCIQEYVVFLVCLVCYFFHFFGSLFHLSLIRTLFLSFFLSQTSSLALFAPHTCLKCMRWNLPNKKTNVKFKRMRNAMENIHTVKTDE